MDNAAVPTQNNLPVAPVETVTPAQDPSSINAVANVSIDYPESFKNFVSAANNNTPQGRIDLVNNMEAQQKEDKVYRPNQEPQWGKVLASLAAGDYQSAYKWYNGGAVKEVQSRSLNNEEYYKEYNEIGATGRIKDRNGNLLTSKQIKELNDRGGIFNKEDMDTLQTAPWVNGKYNSILANRGLTNRFDLATNDAANSARIAGAANNNIDEQLQIAQGLRPVLDHISRLPTASRQKLFGYISRLNQIAGSGGTQSERRLNVGTGASQTAGMTGNVGIGKASSEGISPGVGLGGNTSATNQANVSGGGVNAATTSQSNMLQEQQTLQAAIMQEMQGVIKDSSQFQQFLRLNALNDANYAAYKDIPDHVLPPSWQMIPSTDVFSGGADRMIANLVSQQRNNALLAAWSKDLYKSQRDMVNTGKSTDLGEQSDKFIKSEIFNAINNTYTYKMESYLKNQLVRPPKGTKVVNGRNQIITYEGE